MKFRLTLLLLLALAMQTFAQAPQAMNYQAVARNASGNPYVNQLVALRISVLDGSATGTAVYVEQHSVTTNQFGLFTLAIGQGLVQSGSFAAINWSTGNKWLKIELDPNGGVAFAPMGVSELLSVPYALYAANGGGGGSVQTTPVLSGNGTAANPLTVAQQGATNGQVLTWNGSAWAPANGGGDNWGSQTASTTTALTGNGTAANPLGIAQQGATNGQVLTWNGSAWTPANGGGDNWGTQTAVTNATLTGNGTAASPLGLASQAATNGQVLSWNGSAWVPVTLAAGTGPGDNWGTQVASTTTVLSGNGTAASPLNLAQQGASSGQVLKWNGSSWAPGTDNTGSTSYTGGTGIAVVGTVISNTGDTNASDDITNTTTAGGDLSGTYPNPNVDGLQGNPVSATSPSSGQVLTWNGSAWAPATPTTGSTYSAGTGISIAGNVISNTGDLSNTNELQTLSIVGNTLSISPSGNSVTLPSGGGGSYTGGTGITITGSNVINSNWTASGNDIFNNNTGNVGVGGAASATDKLNVTPGSLLGGVKINYTSSTIGSYGLNTTGSSGNNYLHYSGTISLGSQTITDPLMYSTATSGGTHAFFGTTTGTNTSAAIVGFSNVWHGGYYYANGNVGHGLVGLYEGGGTGNGGAFQTTGSGNGAASSSTYLGTGLQASYGALGIYGGSVDTSAGVYGFNVRATGGLNTGVRGEYNFNSYGIGVAGIGYNGQIPTSSTTDYGVWGSCDNSFGGYAVYADGDLTCTGAKNASVPTSQGNQLVYSVESPEVWFEDFGHATLVNGEVTIQLDQLFLETVQIDPTHPMIVAVTPEGDCKGLYVEPGTTSFKVKELNGGTSSISFSFRITCKRLNYQDHRFGADLTWGAGDTRSKAHYLQPKPIAYEAALNQSLAGKKAAAKKNQPVNNYPKSMLTLKK